MKKIARKFKSKDNLDVSVNIMSNGFVCTPILEENIKTFINNNMDVSADLKNGGNTYDVQFLDDGTQNVPCKFYSCGALDSTDDPIEHSITIIVNLIK